MSLKSRLYFAIVIILAFIGELIFLGWLAVVSVQAAETAPEGKFTRSALGLLPRSLNLILISPVVADGNTVGAVAVYDDPSTQRLEDYLELYDREGDLVAVGWFDRFGIQRMAVDRALVDGDEELQGVFVTVVDGDLI
jgi:hypothetical protein